MKKLELDLPEYNQRVFNLLIIYLLASCCLLFVLGYLGYLLMGILSFFITLIIFVKSSRQNRKKTLVYKDINNTEAWFTEIKELPFFGSYVNRRKFKLDWSDVEVVSIMLYQPSPMNYFLIIKGNNILLKSKFNRNIEFLESDGRYYWEIMHDICLDKSRKFGFKFEVTELFGYILSNKEKNKPKGLDSIDN